VEVWIKSGSQVTNKASYIWNNLMEVKHWLIGNLKWEIGEGTLVEIGLDPIRGFLEKHYLPCQLIRYIHDKGIYFLY